MHWSVGDLVVEVECELREGRTRDFCGLAVKKEDRELSARTPRDMVEKQVLGIYLFNDSSTISVRERLLQWVQDFSTVVATKLDDAELADLRYKA